MFMSFRMLTQGSNKGGNLGVTAPVPTLGLTRGNSAHLRLIASNNSAGIMDGSASAKKDSGLTTNSTLQEQMTGPTALLALYRTFESW